MQFIKGMDVSMQKELEANGAKYYLDGTQMDLFTLFQKTGINTVRLRIWNDPYDENKNPYGGGTNDFDTTIELAKRIVANQLDFILDFHYSDFWTDPSKQIKPKAWADKTGAELEEAVYRYTKDTLNTFMKQGIFVKMVQIGNEITKGFLWPDGHIGQPERMAALLKSGMRAVREYNPKTKIILHLDYGTDNEIYRSWFEKTALYGLDYDIIGMSYYPYWNGSQEELLTNMNDMSQTLGKDILVAETAIGYTTDSLGCSGMIFAGELEKKTPYPASKEGQKNYIRDLTDTIKKVKNRHGIGFIYWEPSWLPIPECTWASSEGCEYIHDKAEMIGNSWANQALFDRDGEANDVFKIWNEI